MFIELTRTSGTILKINVLSIKAVESGSQGGMFSFAMEETAVTVGSATYYVKESFNEVSEKMEKAYASIPFAQLKNI